MSSWDKDTFSEVYNSEPAVSPPGLRVRRSKRKSKNNNEVPNNIITVDLTEPDLKPKKKRIQFEEDGIEFSMDEDSDFELEEDFRVIWTPTFTEKRYSLKPSEVLLSVYEDLSNIHGIPVRNIHLKINSRILSRHDTLQAINMKVTDVIEAYPMTENIDNCNDNNASKVKVKCLFKNVKKPVVFYLYPTQSINHLLDLCAKEINSSVDILELRFDGEKISPEDTPCSLEFEGGECLEVHIKKS